MTLFLDQHEQTGLVPQRKISVAQKIEYALAPFGSERACYGGLVLEGTVLGGSELEIFYTDQRIQRFLESRYERLGGLRYTHDGFGVAFQSRYAYGDQFKGIIEVGSNDERLAIKYMTTRHPGTDLTRNGVQEEIKALKRAIPELKNAHPLMYNNIDAILGGLVTIRAQ